MYKKIITSSIVICLICINNAGYCESYFDAYVNVFGGGLAKKYPNAKNSRVQCEKLIEEYFKSFSTLNQNCSYVYIDGKKVRVCSGYDADQLGISRYYKQIYCDPDYAKKLAAQKKEYEKQQLEIKKQEKIQYQKYLQEHAKLVREIDGYKMSLPNLDFKVHNKYKSSYNTLIKDTYAVFNAPKNKFDMIPNGAIFYADLQRVFIPNGYNIDYYLENSKRPVYRKYPIANSLIDITKDKRYYRFTFISENLYKNPELKRAKNTSVLHYQPDSRDGKIELSDVRKWFEEYKKTLSPYLSEYQKVKSEMVKVEQEELALYRKDLSAKSMKLKKKYPDKTIGDFINSKQKLKLKTTYSIHDLSSKFTIEQLYALKIGHCYLYDGKEIELHKLSDSNIKKKNYLFVDKSVIKELKDLANININKEADFSYYMKCLQDRIKSNWHPVSSLQSDIVVFFKIARDGSLLDCKIKKSSGNKQDEEAALNAVWYSFPFWYLPKNYLGKEVSVEFSFTSQKPKEQEYKIIPF